MKPEPPKLVTFDKDDPPIPGSPDHWLMRFLFWLSRPMNNAIVSGAAIIAAIVIQAQTPGNPDVLRTAIIATFAFVLSIVLWVEIILLYRLTKDQKEDIRRLRVDLDCLEAAGGRAPDRRGGGEGGGGAARPDRFARVSPETSLPEYSDHENGPWRAA